MANDRDFRILELERELKSLKDVVEVLEDEVYRLFNTEKVPVLNRYKLKIETLNTKIGILQGTRRYEVSRCDFIYPMPYLPGKGARIGC